MIDHSRRTGAAIEAHYQFLVWLMPTVGKFPRSHKFTLGDRIEAVALGVLEALIEAIYTKERNQHLRAANLGIVRSFGSCSDSRPIIIRSFRGAATGSGPK